MYVYYIISHTNKEVRKWKHPNVQSRQATFIKVKMQNQLILI